MASERGCVACDKPEGKYKCVTCAQYTCSLPCFKQHRDTHPPVETDSKSAPGAAPAAGAGRPANPEAEGRPGGDGTLSSMADMPEYKTLMTKYPQLDHLLWNIAQATDPPSAENGGDVKFSALGPKGKGGPKNNHNNKNNKTKEPWTKDKGVENGVYALRHYQDAHGDDRVALREFQELIRLYKARIESQKSEVELRREAARNDAQAINQLLRSEKSEVP